MNRNESRKHGLSSWAFILSVTLGFLPAEAQVGFSHRAGSLFRLDLVTDGSPIVPVVVGDTGIPGTSGALALGPDGMLYAAHSQWMHPYGLFAIDPETAEATRIGDLDLGGGSALWSDMTFDDEGRLWLLCQGTLFQVDPATADTTEIATGLDALETLAHRHGVLYGVAGDPQTSVWSLVSIDSATGDLTPLADISGIASSGCFAEIPEAADFDTAGGLWIAVNVATTCIDPPFFETTMVYLADPLEGAAASRSSVWGDGPTWFPGLALQPARQVVEVPTLGLPGLLLLSMALVATALSLLRSSIL